MEPAVTPLIPIAQHNALIDSWRGDHHATYCSWFFWEERLKNFRSIRRGIGQIMRDDLLHGAQLHGLGGRGRLAADDPQAPPVATETRQPVVLPRHAPRRAASPWSALKP